MEITWYGLACFRVRSRGLSVVTDPFDNSVGVSLPRLRADVVTISHDVPGHNNISAVRGNDHVFKGPGEYEVNSVFITGVPTFHKGKAGERERNTSFVYMFNDGTVCHLGDMGILPSREQVELLSGVDILLLPVGGGDILDAAKAVEIVTELEPRVVIPMHYQQSAIAITLDDVDKFLKEMGVPAPEVIPTLKIGKSDLADEETRVVLLAPQGVGE
ncbi:MAG: MBL fold metallo-hydrolase [Chloroflexi bacterium]|nr:MBL fold metallo-hydrolase [Chloroflexota bacterium]